MRNKVLSALQQWVRPGDTVVCALSGGADSVAMTHCLFSLREKLGITLSACHFNHQLRGESSQKDEAFCRQLCDGLGIPLTVGSNDVAARCKTSGESLEEAARACRYDFFSQLPGLVATAHTADDQLETVLLNLLRGTGLKGLGGIPPRRDRLIRPMLHVSRDEILNYLQENNLPHREDESNALDDCVRNRLRHHVVPLLKKENPGLLHTTQRMTELLQQDEKLLQTQAKTLLQGSEDEGWQIQPLINAPAVLRNRALRSLLQEIPKVSRNHITVAENLVLSQDPSAKIHLPGGYILRREYHRIFLETSLPPAGFEPVCLPCPGHITVPELGLTFHTSLEASSPIIIRPRKTGDRIRLPGGTRSVKKLLIDHRIPAAKRGCIPVLEQDGMILCVWGVAGEAKGITVEKE